MKFRYTVMAAVLLGGLATAGRAEWQLSAGGGASYTRKSDLHITQSDADFTIDGVRWKGRPFEMPAYYDLRATYFLPRHPSFGFFTGVTHMKVYAQKDDILHIHGVIAGEPIDTTQRMFDTVQKYNISHGVNYLAFGIMGRLKLQADTKFPDGRIQPYLGLALCPVINHPENAVRDEDNDQDYENNPTLGGMAVLGVRYALNRHFGVYTEAKQTHVRDRVNVATGHGATTLNTTHVAFGISYGF